MLLKESRASINGKMRLSPVLGPLQECLGQRQAPELHHSHKPLSASILQLGQCSTAWVLCQAAGFL